MTLRRSNRLILLLGFVIAAIAFFGIVLLLQESPAGTTTNTPDELPTVFTKADIPLGTVITSDMLEVKTFPVEQRDPTAFADGSLVVGKLAVTPLAAGKQLVKADFSADAAQAAIAQNLPKGLRAHAGKELHVGPVAGRRETPLDVVEAQVVQLSGHLDFVVRGEGNALRLRAISQGGVIH